MNSNIQLIQEAIALKPTCYVPVIGESFFRLDDKSLFDSFFDYILAENHTTIEDFLFSEPLQRFQKCSVIKKELGIEKMMKTRIDSFIARNRNKIKIDPILIDFLSAGKFPLILTSCPWFFLEDALKDIADYKPYEHKWAYENATNDEQISENDFTIYHLFGSESSGKWAYDEKTLLTCLYSYQDRKHSSSLPRFLKDKNLIVLDDSLPNWLFRFLWYPISNHNNTKTDEQEGLWIVPSEIKPDFNVFLDEIGYMTENKQKDFIIQTTSLLKGVEITNEYKFDIFLSYNHADKEIAHKIFNEFKKRGLNVWFDEDINSGKLTEGGEYWERIKLGIKRSRYYMPIISENFIMKYQQWNERKECIPNSDKDGVIYETYLVDQERKNRIEIQRIDNNKYIYELPVIVNSDSQNQMYANLLESLRNSLFNHAFPYLFREKQYYFYPIDLNKDNKDFFVHNWELYIDHKLQLS